VAAYSQACGAVANIEARGAMTRDLPVVVLVGGLGKRLRSAFDGPKALAPIAGRPVLEYLVANICRQGYRDLALCVGYKADLIQQHFGDGHKFGVQIRYSVEEKPLGTAGALKKATEVIDQDEFFALNGDSFVDIDFGEMAAFHAARNALATIAATRVSDAQRYGTVEMDASGRIRAFHEKSSVAEQPGWVNAGVYLLTCAALEGVRPNVEVSIERDVFPNLLGQSLYAYCGARDLIDIGVPADFERAQVELPRRLRERSSPASVEPPVPSK
jgi:D-glycero-alpha-D-manno-heptose 1-phosphate guanylyltransferase